MDVEAYIAAIAAGSAVVTSLALSYKRCRDIRALAEQLGFAYLRKALPREVVLAGTEVEGITNVWNVIDGQRTGVRTIAFDCRIGYGKASWRRTVIAMQDANLESTGLAAYDLRVERAGSWQIAYRPKTVSLFPKALMPIPELTAYLE